MYRPEEGEQDEHGKNDEHDKKGSLRWVGADNRSDTDGWL
jgi:hypothetical protein